MIEIMISAGHSVISVAHAFQELYNLSSALRSHLTRASDGQWNARKTLGTGEGGAATGRVDSAAPLPHGSRGQMR